MDEQVDRMVGGRGAMRAAVTLALSLIACGAVPALAAAEVVTIGTPTAEFGTSQMSAACNACTQYQDLAPADAPPGLVETAPADGVIIDWRVAGTGTFTLEAIRTAADGSQSIVGESGGAASSGSGTTPVHIPVLAGDSIGVHLSGSNPRVYNNSAQGPVIDLASPDIPGPPTLRVPGLLSLNADVAITPIVTSVTPNTGPTGGTNLVTITGQYLDGSTTVMFGSLPAAFAVVSSTQITAYAPLQGPGMVDVRVVGPGAPSPISTGDEFTYLPKAGAGQTPGGSSPSGSGPPLVLSPVSLSASTFLAAPSGASLAKTATGTTLTYTVSAAATTRFLIEQVAAGRMLPAVGPNGVATCAPVNQATLPEKLAKCTRYIGLTPELSHTGPAGRNVVRLSGRLNGHALAPGSYRLLATATATGSSSEVSASVTHSFRILAPPKPATKRKPTAHAALPSNGSGAVAGPTG
jgi:hypothetical protein